MGNTIAVERDWVIIVSSDLSIPLEDMNATMRRIDLTCKLVAPLFISLIDAFSTSIAIYTTIGLNVVSALIEYFAIARVYNSISKLAEPRSSILTTEIVTETPARDVANPSTDSSTDSASDTPMIAPKTSFSPLQFLSKIFSPWKAYIRSPPFLASFALSVLYLSVLSTGPQITTYLLTLGYTSLEVSIIRLAGVVLELSATFVAPFLMKRIGPVRAGLWLVNEQLICVSGGASVFLFVAQGLPGFTDKLRGGLLMIGVAFSRLGLWGFDLCVQYIVQQASR